MTREIIDPRVSHLTDSGWVGVDVDPPVEVPASSSTAPFSYVHFPAGSFYVNALTAPDEPSFSGPSQLDVRFAVDGVGGGTTVRTVISSYHFEDNQRSWAIQVNADAQIEVLLSTDGTIAGRTIVTCDAALSSNNNVILGRFTWRSSDGRIQFFRKAAGSIASSIAANTGWTQIGSNEAGPTAALHDSTADLSIGNISPDVFAEPFIGNLHAVTVANTIDGAAVFSLLPADIPADTDADELTASTGQTVTVWRAVLGPRLSLAYQVIPPGIRVSPSPDPIVGLYYAATTSTIKPIVAAYYVGDDLIPVEVSVP